MANVPQPIEGVEGEFNPIPPTSSGDGLSAYQEKTDKRFADIEQLTKAIIFVAIISLVGIIATVAGLVIDQMHFNNQTYIQQSSDNKEQLDLLKAQVTQLKNNNDYLIKLVERTDSQAKPQTPLGQ